MRFYLQCKLSYTFEKLQNYHGQVELLASCCPVTMSHSKKTIADTPLLQWQKNGHCLELDGVRGVAILLVTFYRFAKELDSDALPWAASLQRIAALGTRGVDLFFVLSGLLITSLLLSTKNRAGYFLGFYYRRSLRIFPLYFLALAICLWLLPALNGTHIYDLAAQNQSYLWTYTTNVYMMWMNQWSFGPLDHFWSLAVEEHFYLLWPAVVMALSRKSLFRFSISLFFVVTIARAVFALQPRWSVAIETFTLFRCDGLALGAALACYLTSDRSLLPESKLRFRRICLCLLPLLSLSLVIMGSLKIRWLGLENSIAPLICVLVLGLMLTSTNDATINWIARSNVLRWFGRYSYGMYVVQLPVAAGLREMHRSYLDWMPLGYGSTIPCLAGFALTCGLAFATYHLIEKHFLKLKSIFTCVDNHDSPWISVAPQPPLEQSAYHSDKESVHNQ